MARPHRSPNLLQALTPILVLIVLIALNVVLNPGDTLGGGNQLSLLIASAVAFGITAYNGVSWDKTIEAIQRSVAVSTPAIIILLIVGMLSGTWMLSGVIPSMIYYGLDIISPSFFLPATVIICSIISVAVGSSWSTVATVGVALIGIGDALGFNPAIVAGAIVSGAYFGDKISPLSDTTTLAATIGEVPLFDHIRYMLQTSLPTLAATIVIFIAITLSVDSGGTMSDVEAIQHTIATNYNISPWLLLLPASVVFMIVKKISPTTVLFVSAVAAAIVAVFTQSELIASLAGESSMSTTGAYNVVTKAMYGPTAVETGNSSVDALLSTRGMKGMIDTIWLIIMAMIYSGTLEAGGLLERIVRIFTKSVKSAGGAVAATASTSLLFNLTAGDQYLSIMIPGRMFKGLYERLKLRGVLLSRTLEDGGTVTSVLVPWNTCGATQAAILGVATISYAPFAFFCILSPIVAVVVAYLKIGIKREL